MKRSLICVLIAAASCTAPPVDGDPEAGALGEAEAAETVSPEGGAAALARRRASSAPGEELAALATLVGDWDLRIEAGDMELGAGAASIAPVLGGRFLEWRVTTRIGEVEVRSRGLLGFDRERGLHELTWAGEGSSAQRIARGRGDAHRGGILLELAELDPEDGGVRRSRTRLRITSPEAFSLAQETWDPEAGDWRPLTVTSYRRQSAGEARD